MSEPKHIVAISGGKDSCAMALRLAETEPRDYEFICTPTGNELPEMVEHWRRLRDLLGYPLRAVVATRDLLAQARKQNCIPNSRMRWCTRTLKLDPYKSYLLSNLPCIAYVGIRADEVGHDRPSRGVDWEKHDGVTLRYPLVEWGWGVTQVYKYLEEREVVIPRRTDCALCFYQTLGEWFMLWRDHRDEYEKGVELEAEIGHTFRSDARDTWPAGLAPLAARFSSVFTPRGAAQDEFNLGVHSRKAMCSFCAR